MKNKFVSNILWMAVPNTSKFTKLGSYPPITCKHTRKRNKSLRVENYFFWVYKIYIQDLLLHPKHSLDIISGWQRLKTLYSAMEAIEN